LPLVEVVARLGMALGLVGLLASLVALIVLYNAPVPDVLAGAIFVSAGWYAVWAVAVVALATVRRRGSPQGQ